MVSTSETGFWSRYSKAFEDWELQNFGIRLHRLWMVLLVLALPFFFIAAADYFESMERSGTFGAIVADTMLPAMLVGFLVLLYVLKRHKI